MKDIVFVIGNYKNGGVARRATNLACEFAKRGYNAVILVTRGIAEDVYFDLYDGVKIVSLDEYVKSHNKEKNDTVESIKKRIKKLKRLQSVRNLAGLDNGDINFSIRGLRRGENLSYYTDNHKDSVYITFGAGIYEQTYFACEHTGSKLIYAERNAPELEYPEDERERKRYFKILSKADGAVFQTGKEIEFFGDTFKNAVVIHNPVKPNLPERFKGERRKTAVNFCRMAPQKNIKLMIDAFCMFHENHGDYDMLIYGNTVGESEEAYRDEMIFYLKKKRADEFIKILPPCADVHEKIVDCAMFVSSSDFEGLSNSMVEAMAIGMPCVCTDCLGGGAREIINDGENGVLVPMNDISALSEGMAKVADDKNFSEKISANAYKLRDELTAEKIAEKWIKTINNIC